ncbi:unnamed protein product [Hermetia illucens]|uniref:Protein SAAL1 n=1 Tax=Hermetia illucens TaxID=343691 RepID=A0A7R8YNE9_HERIL|nr:uncharacterized protein LOC119660811 [Hermetia illucens]XP_037925594.1 uncharacterized protein LOC119660811 [Hermetia illucens]XP_037925603.1 uncharacterized protein LOC119660811 [Hermetia illucens]CAD7078405.1 unnamed protein product [Hermetia illucens]
MDPKEAGSGCGEKQTDPKDEGSISTSSVVASCNPSASDAVEEEELEKLKGDAIGDTLFSERFVLSTLLTVVSDKDLAEYEQDLCTLWDMTIEHDVVKLLLQYQTLEIFSTVIHLTDDRRLTEILVGIVANMCDYPPTRKELAENVEFIAPILDLISCSDTLTLIQLMRFISALLVSDEEIDPLVWFGCIRNSVNFVQFFSLMLSNSMSRQLLTDAVSAMNAFCVKFSLVEEESESSIVFRDLFVHEYLVIGLIVAFQTLALINEDPEFGMSSATKKVKKLHSTFLHINVKLLQYEEYSDQAYASVLTEFLKCIANILEPFYDSLTLLSVSHYELEILDSVSQIFELLSYPFEEESFKRVIEIWDIIESQRGADQDVDDEWNTDDTWNEFGKENSTTLMELFVEVAMNATEEQLIQVFHTMDKSLIEKIVKSGNEKKVSDDLSGVFNKIRRLTSSTKVKAAQ